MARLPTVTDDVDQWGTILNAFLDVSFNPDGTLDQTALTSTGRATQLLNALGFKGETFPIQAGNVSAAVTSQNVFGCAVYFSAGEVITNLLVNVGVAAAGTAPTLIRMGILNSARVVQAITAELHSDAGWTSQGIKAYALTSQWTVPVSGLYYLVFLENGAFATTPLQLMKSSGNIGIGGAGFGANPPRYGTFGTAATDLPAVGATASAWASVTTSIIWQAWN